MGNVAGAGAAELFQSAQDFYAVEGSYQILTYLNLGASFLCVDDGTGLYTCQKVLVDAEENFLGITPSTSREELTALLGERFSTLTLDLTAERSAAAQQLSLELPASGRVDKYLMSTYYIKLYYDAAGTRIAAVECGSY